ncbi:MAG: single-stranded DNA-binding protein [Chloroflexi bacterium]|nr:single-stranded DNA-binding protein [Chloroflexota bacterium]
MYQQTIIVGNLGRDPEMRYTNDGTPVTSFTVAVNRRWTTADGRKGEKTTWFKVSCWRRLAETTYQYLKKGRQVMVVGEVEASAYTSRDGQARASLEITAREVKFLQGGGSSTSDDGMYDSQDSSEDSYTPQTEEDLPF